MDFPHPDDVEALLLRSGLTGAERDVLEEYLSQSVGDWQADYDAERDRRHAQEDGEEPDPEDEDFADRSPVEALIRRVNTIVQNHR